MEPTFEFTARTWLHPKGSWVFVTVPEDESDEIRDIAPHPGGFGSVRVRVVVGGSEWKTSVFPQRDDGPYVLPVKKDIRRRESIEIGDDVEIALSILID